MLNVLIVDDDKNLCECLFCLMPWEAMGCNPPFVAYDGLEAWELLNRETVDFVICDLKMPILEGVELRKRMIEHNMKIDMVFLSAYEDFSTARQAMQYGVSDYILKPVNRETLTELEKIIRRVKEKKQQEKNRKRFFSGDYQKRILQALCDGDRAFLEQICDLLAGMDASTAQNAGLRLLHRFYDYLSLLQQDERRAETELQLKKWQEQFLELSEPARQAEFLRTRCFRLLEQAAPDSETERIVKTVRKLVEENFRDQKCNVTLIGERIHMSPAYVGKIFRKSTGVGLMEYITEWRLKEACRLLAAGQYSINQIAAMIGYADANYFTKVFRGKMGMSPSDYRAKHAAQA